MDDKSKEKKKRVESGNSDVKVGVSKKVIVKRMAIITIVSSILIAASIYFYPRLRQIQQDPEPYLEKIRGLGFGAAFLLIFLTSIQVIIPFIPGEIVEILTGAIFGPWLGLLIIQIGVALGIAIVYYMVKFLGTGFAKTMVGDSLEKKIKFMDNPKRLEVIFFFTLLMPMVPKDVIAFILPLSKVKLSRFLVLNAIARTPSIIASTMLGNAVVMGEFSLTIVIMVLSAIIGLLGLIFNKKIVAYIEQRQLKKEKI